MSEKNFISILIASSKDYHIFSPICLFFIKKHILPHHNYTVYYANETPLNDEIVNNIDTNSNIDERFSEAGSLHRMLYAVEKCDSEYIWFMQEDHWYLNHVFNKKVMDKIESVIKEYNLDQLKLFPMATGGPPLNGTTNIKNDILCNDEDLIISWAKSNVTGRYPVSHNCTIFNKEYLVNNIKTSLTSRFQPTYWGHEYFNYYKWDKVRRYHSEGPDKLNIASINYVYSNPNRPNEYCNAISHGIINDRGIKILNKQSEFYEEISENGDDVRKNAGSKNIFKDLLELLQGTTFLKENHNNSWTISRRGRFIYE